MRIFRLMTTVSVLLTLAMLQTGCIKEDNDDCPKLRTLIVKAYDGSGAELGSKACSDVTLFFYTDDLLFTEKVDTQIGESVIVSVPAKSSIHVVGWGNLANGSHSCTMPEVGDHKSTCCVTLKNNTARTANIAQSPGDLFRGATDIDSKGDDTPHILPVYREVGSMAITVRGLKEFTGFDDDNYSIVVGETHSTIAFDGALSGKRVSYAPKGAFAQNAGSKDYYVAPFNLLPEKGLTIYVYHGDTLIGSATVDAYNQPIDVNAGQLTNVLLKFGTDMEINLKITDWGEVYLWKEFGN